MNPANSLAVIDLGGQYCHLISRRLRQLGFSSRVFDYTVDPHEVGAFAGVILSGGPRSVNDDQPPRVDPALLALPIPILGICYGHQLLAKERGAEVIRGKSEFGASTITATTDNSIFAGTPTTQTVWMSHSDSVLAPPAGFRTVASTPDCDTAAFANEELRVYGLQFHPEVDHSTHGSILLGNFARLCGLTAQPQPASRKDEILAAIRERAGDNKVFFLVSGGVDSMVAFSLCAAALGPDRVRGLYVDTGFMRKGESEELIANLEPLGLAGSVTIRDESATYFHALANERGPEGKRHIIGRLFVEIQSAAMRDLGIDEEHWLLGQGTIYPDTIESGGSTGRAAVIKTHHNRCAEILHLIEKGRVIEPLSDLYKDEVRDVGRDLGLSETLVRRWPFPGPGLAIRALCMEPAAAGSVGERVGLPPEFAAYSAYAYPVWSVGVQGDARTYRRMVVVSGPLDYGHLHKLSTWLCNENAEFNRVTFLLAPARELFFGETEVASTALTRDRISRLQEADAAIREVLTDRGLLDSVWQFPVVLLPLVYLGGETIVLRPVDSVNGMTASFSRIAPDVLDDMVRRIQRDTGVGAVLLDVTDKPPATIEWE